eukprot:scaffold131801_cov17-Tisochrysis_lutea.AAC.1
MPRDAFLQLCEALHGVNLQQDCAAILAFCQQGRIWWEWPSHVPMAARTQLHQQNSPPCVTERPQDSIYNLESGCRNW